MNQKIEISISALFARILVLSLFQFPTASPPSSFLLFFASAMNVLPSIHIHCLNYWGGEDETFAQKTRHKTNCWWSPLWYCWCCEWCVNFHSKNSQYISRWIWGRTQALNTKENANSQSTRASTHDLTHQMVKQISLRELSHAWLESPLAKLN